MDNWTGEKVFEYNLINNFRGLPIANRNVHSQRWRTQSMKLPIDGSNPQQLMILKQEDF
jgi:hypothetical protein